MQRIAPDATALGDGSMPFMFSLDAIWSKVFDDTANINWARDSWQSMQRFSTGPTYLNFPGLGEGENLLRVAVGSRTYGPLQAIKHK